MKHIIASLIPLVASFGAMGAEPKTDLCLLCHGTNVNGNASVRAPKLAGLDRAYLQRQLTAFRSDLRGMHALDVSGSEMRIIARSLSEAEMKASLDFVTKQKSERPLTMIQGDPKRGVQLYASCASCHGNHGEGNPSLKAPALAQGSDWYWVIQLNNYRNGLRGATRGDDVGFIMRAAAQTLNSDQAVLDVVAYINTF